MKKLIAILTVVLMLSLGCNQTASSEIKISEAENGQNIQLKKGDVLILTLEGNPSTGFAWDLDSLETSVLRQVDEPLFTPDSAALGATGYFVWRFEAINSGQISLRLIYHRSWETDTPPERIFEVTVEVS